MVTERLAPLLSQRRVQLSIGWELILGDSVITQAHFLLRRFCTCVCMQACMQVGGVFFQPSRSSSPKGRFSSSSFVLIPTASQTRNPFPRNGSSL